MLYRSYWFWIVIALTWDVYKHYVSECYLSKVNSCSAMTLVFKTSWFCYFTAFTIITDVSRGQWCLVALCSYSLEGHSYESVCSYILYEVVSNLTKIKKNLKLINFRGHRMLVKRFYRKANCCISPYRYNFLLLKHCSSKLIIVINC